MGSGKPRVTTPAGGLPPRAPLLWILIPQLAGSGVALASPEVPTGAILGLSAGGLALAALPLLLFRDTWKAPQHVVWALGIVLGVTALSWGWTRARTPPLSAVAERWQQLPPREVSLQVTVVNGALGVGPGETRGHAGIGRITRAPANAVDLAGAAVWFRSLGLEDEPLLLTSGDALDLRGVLVPLQNSAYRDYARLSEGFLAHLRQRQVAFALVRCKVLAVETGSYPGRDASLALASRIRAILEPSRNRPEERVLLAMMLGETDGLDPAEKDRFRRTGTLHFFAISGLHIGILASCLIPILRAVGIPFRLQPWIGLPILLAYVAATGFSESAVRAFLMIAAFAGAILLQRKPQPFSALVNSAVLVLLLDPLQWRQPGFQLSYLVVGAILLYGLPLASFWARGGDMNPAWFSVPGRVSPWRRPILNILARLRDSAAISVAAAVVSLPLIAGYFGLVTPISFLLNVPLVFLAFIAVSGGALAIVLGLLHLSFLATLPEWVAHQAIRAMMALAEAVYHIPGSWSEVAPGHGVAVALQLVLCGACMIGLHTHIADPVRHRQTRAVLFTLPIFGVVAFMNFLIFVS